MVVTDRTEALTAEALETREFCMKRDTWRAQTNGRARSVLVDMGQSTGTSLSSTRQTHWQTSISFPGPVSRGESSNNASSAKAGERCERKNTGTQEYKQSAGSALCGVLYRSVCMC